MLSPASILYANATQAITYIVDGSDYLLATVSKLRNVAGSIVNPATEETVTATNTRLGEVQVTPTANTVLARLKEAVTVLTTISGEDFSTEDTLSALLSAFDAEDFASEIALVAFATDFANRDLSTETTLDALLTAFNDEDFATEITLEAVRFYNEATSSSIGAAVETPTQYTVLDRLKSAVTGIVGIITQLTSSVDAGNSSTGQLGDGGIFAGTPVDCSGYATVAIMIHSDQDSALDGMQFQFSMNGTDWDEQLKFNLDASQSQTRRFQIAANSQYFRVYYINGAVTTTELRIQTLLHRQNILTSIHKVEDVVHEDRSAELVKSAIIAQREGSAINDFYPVQSDIGGNLKVTTVGADIPSDPRAFVLEYVVDASDDRSLLVDGSTPKVFERKPTATDEVWSVKQLLLTFTADDFSFDGESFGPNAALINGIKIDILQNSILTKVFEIFQNEDFIAVPGRLPLVNNYGPKDVLGAAISFDGLVLKESEGDLVRVTVQDDLTSTKLKYFTIRVFGSRVI